MTHLHEMSRMSAPYKLRKREIWVILANNNGFFLSICDALKPKITILRPEIGSILVRNDISHDCDLIITQLRMNIISCFWCHIKAPAVCDPMVQSTPYCIFLHENRYVQMGHKFEKLRIYELLLSLGTSGNATYVKKYDFRWRHLHPLGQNDVSGKYHTYLRR